MVALNPAFFLEPEREKAEYDLHRNDPADPRYRAFLARSLDEVVRRVAPPARGLDFGCGPGPALAAMVREAGYVVDLYDPFYADDRAVFERRYAFITCTEVVEHFAHPRRELERLWRMLEPGAPLVIQTGRVLDDARFRTWRYRQDPTHIRFFARESFVWLAAQWDASIDFPQRDVAVLQQRGGEET